MFSSCRGLQTGLILLALGACSKEPAPAANGPPPSKPLVAALPAAHNAAVNTRTVSSRIDATGLAATYEATFEQGERLRIAEQRADSRSGEYEFRGARLLHYSGGGLSSPAAIELGFDLRGAVTLSKSGSGQVPDAEISAIRERAQLLRSHALAQQTTRDHH